MATSSPQPLDLNQLRAHLLAQESLEEVVEQVIPLLRQMRDRNNELTLQLEAFLRQRAGKRSEKVDPGQLSLMLEQVEEQIKDAGLEELLAKEEEEAGQAEEAGEETPGKKRKRGHGRGRLPEHLPREKKVYALSDEERHCPSCDRPVQTIDWQVSEQLEFVPASFQVIRHEQEVVACGHCKDWVKTAPCLDKVFERGLAGPGLLAHILSSKYGDHIPLHRQHQIYLRSGVDLAVSTMCDWVRDTAGLLDPLVAELHRMAISSHLLQTDATGIKVLDPNDPQGVRKGTLWCWVGDRTYAVFRYSPDGTGEEGPWKYLADRQGYLQADAANIFDRLYNGKVSQATEVGCWAHARRGFYELKDTDFRVAIPLAWIQKLFLAEKEADKKGLSVVERMALRQKRSRHILNKLKRWLLLTTKQEPPASAMAKACAYCLNHWDALTRILEDGRLGLDNNLVERQMRKVALGRHNYLFVGSDAGGTWAATAFSLIGSCTLAGVDPETYLADVIARIAGGWPQKRIGELLPDQWIKDNPPAETSGKDPPDSPD